MQTFTFIISEFALMSGKKPFVSTRVIIDGRNCLVGKGGPHFSARDFKERIDSLLLDARADAKHVRNDL